MTDPDFHLDASNTQSVMHIVWIIWIKLGDGEFCNYG